MLLMFIVVLRCYILDFLFQNNSDEWLQTHCGVDCDTLLYIYNKYCGITTIINTHYKLYLVYAYFKIYPTIRANYHCKIIIHIQSIKKYSQYLCSVMNDMNDVWNRRHEMINRTPHLFQNMLTGSIDTFPVIVSRPSNSKISSYLYNGKYKKHVLKIQMMCDHSATPCFLSGPHLGVINDITIFKNNPPLLDDHECIFGDKAYCDKKLKDKIITPIKKTKQTQLSDNQNQYNKILGWYRSSIEHTFGYMKRFRIISKFMHMHTYNC